jgi:hypothetical protein
VDETTFWRIVEDAGAPDECSPDEQCEIIAAALTDLSKEDLIAFENIRHRLLGKLYTWPMLKACFIVLSYVSDDVFEDFRHWIILNGKERYLSVMTNPNNLVNFIKVDDPIEEITGEPLMLVVEDAWEGDIEDIEEHVAFPKVPDIDDDWPPKSGLRREFPELFDKYWNEEAIRKIHGDA